MEGNLSKLVTATIVVGKPCPKQDTITSLPHASKISSLTISFAISIAEATKRTVFATLTASNVAKMLPMGGTIIEKRCLNLGIL